MENIDDIDICILERLVDINLSISSVPYVGAKFELIWEAPEVRGSSVKFPESKRDLIIKLNILRTLMYVKFIPERRISQYTPGYWMITDKGLQVLMQDIRASQDWKYISLIERRRDESTLNET